MKNGTNLFVNTCYLAMVKSSEKGKYNLDQIMVKFYRNGKAVQLSDTIAVHYSHL